MLCLEITLLKIKRILIPIRKLKNSRSSEEVQLIHKKLLFDNKTKYFCLTTKQHTT